MIILIGDNINGDNIISDDINDKINDNINDGINNNMNDDTNGYGKDNVKGVVRVEGRLMTLETCGISGDSHITIIINWIGLYYLSHIGMPIMLKRTNNRYKFKVQETRAI